MSGLLPTVARRHAIKIVSQRNLALGQQLNGVRIAIWHLLRELVSCPEVWLAQCFCEPDESLPYRKLVESAKAEEQRIRIRTSQSESIDGQNFNTLGRRQLFRLS